MMTALVAISVSGCKNKNETVPFRNQWLLIIDYLESSWKECLRNLNCKSLYMAIIFRMKNKVTLTLLSLFKNKEHLKVYYTT